MTNLRKLGLIVSTTAGLAAPALAQTSVADGFEGWCQPTWYAYEGMAPEGHFSAYEYGSVVRLDGFSKSTGEEGDFCQFSNPTAVQGFDAVFLDAQCNGPSWIPGLTSDTPPDRVMLMSASGDRFTGPEASMIMPSNIVELAPCLSYHYSDMHSELGYEPGFRVPEPDSSDARYLAEILNPRWGSGGTFIDGRLQEAVGMEPNFAGRYIIGAMGGCGTDCSIPFFFDTRDGRAIELTLSDDPYAEYANFSFSMISDSGGMIVSWRDGDCVRQEFAPVENSFELIRETRTPYDLSLWSGYPLHCPTAGAVSQDVDDLTSDVLAALGRGGASGLAPVTSLSPRARPSSEISFPGSRTAPLQASPSVPLGQTTLSREQKGDLNFAGICIGHAEEGNALLRARGASTNFNQIIIAARRSIDPLLRQVSDADAYSEFTSWRDATREQLAGNSVQVRTAMVAAFLIECNNKYGL